MKGTLKLLICLIVTIACKPSQITKNKVSPVAKDVFLVELMKGEPGKFSHILNNPDSFRVQIIYTQINRKSNNEPVFTDYYYNLDANQYHYPASTVKLPVALLALERLKELKDQGLTRNTSMITEAAYSKQTPVYNDPTAVDGRPTIEQYIRKILLVSDNDAFNRLYEFLGQEYINKELHRKGYEATDILHRLSIAMSEDENRHTNPIRFYNDSTKLIYDQPMQFNQGSYPVRKDNVGKAYYAGGKLIETPMNFSAKNRLPLEHLHAMVQSIMFPQSVKAKQRFNLSDEEYSFIRNLMSQYPGESKYPEYKSPEYWDAYCKFLYWGAEKGELPKNIRIFNKIGDAYGFLIDAAYFVDFEKKIEFMLSATIYCNSDGILNDDKYDYDSVGFPFMKNLGRLIYDYEVKRAKSVVPDLSGFRN